MKKLISSLILSAVALATPVMAARHDSPDLQLQKMLAGRVAGTPTECIPNARWASSEIVDGKAIVFQVGSTLYVNEPRSGADQLDRDDILVTRTFGSQLCRIDSVKLIDRGSRFIRGFVILDKFVPYTRPKRAG